MAILKVARLGHPVLRKIAEPLDLDRIQDERFQSFLDDLTETRHLQAQRRMFERMVSPAVINQLDPDKLELGGAIGGVLLARKDLGYSLSAMIGGLVGPLGIFVI